MNNNEETNGKSTDNGITIISLNIPITTTEEKLLKVVEILGLSDAPLPINEVDQINLQITLEQEASDE